MPVPYFGYTTYIRNRRIETSVLCKINGFIIKVENEDDNCHLPILCTYT